MSRDADDSEELFREIQEAALIQNRAIRDQSAQSLESTSQVIPNYEILNEIHRGGQGVVYKAIQLSTNRTVALKLILQGSFATERQRFRFEREVDLASRLNHPSIVTVFDGGVAGNQPFLAMELVDGSPLSQYAACESNGESNGESIDPLENMRLVRLCEKICQAIGYAHSKGVIHRDLKPANILVDEMGEPHVVDFGLAKFVDGEDNATYSPRTMSGEFLGTLSYASPEQASGDPTLTDTRSDVYSLGVVFCELLTGQMPYDISGSLAETLSNITDCEPVLSARSAGTLDRDLSTIVLKSLSKDPDRRYQNAGELGDDLRRYLNAEPISARRDSSWYVFSKTIKRHRHATIAAASFLILLVGSLIAIIVLYFQATHDRDLATSSQLDEKKHRQIAVEEAAAADEARKLATIQKDEAEFNGYVSRLAASDASIRNHDTFSAATNLIKATKKHRHFEWWYLLGQIDLSEQRFGGMQDNVMTGHQNGVTTVHYHPLNQWLVSGGQLGDVIFWDPVTAAQIGRHSFGRSVKRVRVHPSENYVVVGFLDGDAAKLMVDDSNEKELVLSAANETFVTSGEQLNDLEFSPDGKRLAIATGAYPNPGSVMIYQWQSAKLLRKLDDENLVWSVAFSPDGRNIASSSSRILYWDVDSGKLLKEFPAQKNWITDLSFDPNGNRIASCGPEPNITIWDLESADVEKQLFGHSGFISSVRYHPNGTTLASASLDGTVRFWNPETGATQSVKWGHTSEIREIAFDPDGGFLASSGGVEIKLWIPTSNAGLGFGRSHNKSVLDICLTSDSKRVFTSDQAGNLNQWDAITQSFVGQIQGADESSSAIHVVRCSSDGQFLAWANDDHNVYLHDLKTGITDTLSGHEAAVTAVCFADDCQTLFSSSLDKTVRQWDTSTKASTLVFESDQEIKNIALDPTGDQLAIAGKNSIVVLAVATGETSTTIDRETGPFATKYPLVFNSDGTQLASTVLRSSGSRNFDFAVVWEIPSGKELAILGDHIRAVRSLAYSSDGKRIATSSEDGTVRIWDTQRFQSLLTLQSENGYANVIAFTHDDNRLIGGMYNGAVRIWKALDESRRD